ncbi:MerR family transcriptional regulator [Rhodococcus sp. BP-252]|uniref:MerR family transcriptional regulator n=1 Tax=unclassified Rhodococcus (in: high G+C Gram-positive bacteria) TaxID=192944 RepID=UPI001C9B9DFC|nr:MULTISPECIES: MerR family transcriptional regulator [unclassified Rhodococcus (in: high G+C Gram-positive bacteria)]MBY6413685.1 MerR family transcriptional regulator [Rhodococcus sp. BP-320]MBY6418328.1 MerR family transcriptional regulator [Rhodococcus sp. BP-321]MBY6422453.1 MerR family transcriptional regulator [Rhodococcus sp. BP-324]MBY6428273.1 MerR family transcriptional regulator [Rhodococcus sp. BP-323]MBY6433450.1 MerR family transcriptional regulator [Rhodococcus sp. BP-322]
MIEYRVDDLARRAGVSVRNVRVYQDRGLLPPPRREGRTGWYNESHLARLSLISSMLDRGYTFATISELLTAAQYGMRVEDVLTGVKSVGSDVRHLSRADMDAMFAGAISDADLHRGVELGVIAADGDAYRVDNPLLVEAARLLAEAGIPVAHMLDEAEGVRRDLDDVAGRFVALITDRFVSDGQDPFDTDARTVADVAELVHRLSPLAHRTVTALFAEAMDRRITLTMEDIVTKFGESAGPADGQAS